MCMPRRIVVRVAQKLNERWQKELHHFEKRSDEVRVSDAISAELALDEELGDLAFQGLQACLAAGYRGWRAEGGVWRKEIEGVTATFDPRTRKLTVAAAMSDVITAAVEKRATVAEHSSRELAAVLDLAGDEGWTVLDNVEQTERRLLQQLETEMQEEKRRKLEAERAKLRAEAQRDLERRWSALSKARREELGRLVVARLHAARPQVECEMNLLLAESYKRALVLLAEQQNGKVTRDDESGSVIDLEITL